MRTIHYVLGAVAVLLAGAVVAALKCRPHAYPDPGRFEDSIREFEEIDRTNPPPRGAIGVTGSSSIDQWYHRMPADLAPLPVIPRGFGGSNLNDLQHFAPRIVLPYQPRAVVIYEGDNDLFAGIAPRTVRVRFEALVAWLHRKLPGARIYYISTKPSPRRASLWPKTVKLNASIRAVCDRDPLLTYIDVATPMLGPDGQPRSELFKEDKLHMNDAGYDLWTRVIKPVLLEKEDAK